MTATPGRLLVSGAHVLTLDPALGDLDDAAVLVEGGRIVAVGPTRDLAARPEATGAERLGAEGAIVMPGFVDTHRHMWQAVLRGCGADHTLGDYLHHVLQGLGRRIDPDEAGLGNLLSALAALDAGITTVLDTSNVNDDPERSDALVAGLRQSGARAVFAYGHGAGHGPGRPAHGGLSSDARRVREDLLPGDDDLVTMGLCVDAWDDESARWNWGMAAELGVVAALHCRGGAWGGRPVSWLGQAGLVRLPAVFIHGTGLRDGELRALAGLGAALSVAPGVELVMGHGLPPVADALAAGLRPALSVDVETTVAADMFTQMRAAYAAGRYAQLHAGGGGDRLTTRQVLEMATVHGAEALGLGDRIGTLTPGKRADLVVLRTDRPGARPLWDPAGAVVSSLDRGDVDAVVVDGRVVKRDGRLVGHDLATLLARADAVRDRLGPGAGTG